MSAPTTRDFLTAQLLQTGALFEKARSHPLMGPQMERKQQELQSALDALKDVVRIPKTVLFFSGDPVVGSVGIDAKFVADVLAPFQEMVKSEFSLTANGRLGARGPRKGEAAARLLLTGMPRGSVGLELTPPQPEDLFTAEQLEGVFTRLANVMGAAAKGQAEYESAVGKVAGRVVPRLKDFFAVLAKSNASIEVRTEDEIIALNPSQVGAALDRVSSTDVKEFNLTIVGVFRGATLDSWRFDFVPEGAPPISGDLDEGITEEQAAEWNKRTNQTVNAVVRKTDVVPKGGAPRTSYVLANLV